MKKYKVHYVDGSSGMSTLCGASTFSVDAFHVNDDSVSVHRITCKKCRKICKARRGEAHRRGMIYV